MLRSGFPSNFLADVLSTIKSPVFSEVTVFYRDYDIRGAYSSRPSLPPACEVLQAEMAPEASRHHSRFGMYRAMHEVRDFRLVLCADVWDRVGDYAVRMLREAVATEETTRGFDTFPKPLVVYSPRTSRPGNLLEGFWDDSPIHRIPPQ